ncbi:MAG: ABC transporter substrate-binding protein, partial [Thermomicrobiales bacterium]
TWKWVTAPDNGASSLAVWSGIKEIAAKDDRTAVVTMKAPSFAWYEPFTGVFNGILLPAHAFNNDPGNRNDAFLTAPIGTGPYVVTDFSSTGEITYAINAAYREQAKPWFRALAMTVGTDPAAAANAVASGAIDFAAGFALDPAAGATPDAAGTPGVVVTVASSSVEALRFNFSDPATTVQGEVSQKDTPHPIFSDPRVRQALNTAVNRGQIAATVYGAGVHTDANVLVGLASWTAKDTGWSYNLDAANRILDDAGWTRTGDTRSKDGVDLAFEIVAPASDRRQQTLAILQEDFAKIGATVTVTPIDPTEFFSFDPAGAQSFYAMPWDAGLWADGTYSPAPLGYLRRWYAGPKGANIAQKANGWLSTQEVFDGVIADTQRYANPDYDTLYESLETTLGQQDADALLLQMNDMLVKDVVIVPIVVLANRVGVAARLRRDNLGLGAFVSPLWNIANWNETGDTAS